MTSVVQTRKAYQFFMSPFFYRISLTTPIRHISLIAFPFTPPLLCILCLPWFPLSRKAPLQFAKLAKLAVNLAKPISIFVLLCDLCG